MFSFFSSYTYSSQKKAPCTSKKGKGKSCDRDDLVFIVGPSFKNKNLIEALKVKGLSKKHKKSLCLVWFVHNILWARDVNNNISLGLIKLSEDLEVINNYPWGYESFKITVKYLLTPSAPKTVNLYGFPWAFMKKLLLNNIDNMLLFLWKYGEQKAQKSYASDNKDPRRAKPNSIAPDEEQLVHTE
ncbi:hypothetical protein BC332_05642 [Capsicum chinense]|nr:hypothetical protein BC332_05642 [Capsicum chinense]